MKPIQKISLVALSGALMAISFEIYAARGLGFLSQQVGLLIMVWTVLPYVIIWSGRYFFQRCDVLKQWLRFAVIEVILVAYLYWQVLVIDQDAQGALIFLFLPLIQSGINLVWVGLLYLKQHTLIKKGMPDQCD